MRVSRGLATVLALSLVACASDTTAPSSTPLPETTVAVQSTTTHATEHPTTSTDAATTTSGSVANGDLPAALSTADLPADAPCAVGDVPDGGQTTFVIMGRLWGRNADGTVVCLADLEGRNPSWISWSPDGDEVLVGPDTVLRSDGTFVSTGYFPDNRSLRWSYPTGKALIAPNADTGHLIWRNAHDSTERIDVSFADRTTTAAYHPAGKHIAAAGTGGDGLGEGVFLASNRGANVQRIGQIEAGEVSDLAFEESGDSIVFLHHHRDGPDELHRYTFSTSFLETIATTTGEQVSDLVASPADQGALAWSTSHSTLSSVVHAQVDPSAAAVAVAIAESVVRPLGWLPGQRLLVGRATPPAAIDAPYDVWEWGGGRLGHVIDGVSAAAARTPHGPFLELTIIQGSGFG